LCRILIYFQNTANIENQKNDLVSFKAYLALLFLT